MPAHEARVDTPTTNNSDGPDATPPSQASGADVPARAGQTEPPATVRVKLPPESTTPPTLAAPGPAGVLRPSECTQPPPPPLSSSPPTPPPRSILRPRSSPPPYAGDRMQSVLAGTRQYNRSWCCRCGAWHTGLDLQNLRCVNCVHPACDTCAVEFAWCGSWIRRQRWDLPAELQSLKSPGKKK